MKAKQGMIYAGVAGASGLLGAAITGLWASVTNPDDFAPYAPGDDDCIASAMTETFSLSPQKEINRMPEDGSIQGEFVSDAFTAITNLTRTEEGTVSLLSLTMFYNNTPTGLQASTYQIDFSSGHGLVGRTDVADAGRDDATLNLLLLMNGALNRCAYDIK